MNLRNIKLKKKIIIPISILAIGVGAYFIFFNKKEETDISQEYTMFPVQKGDITESISASGTIETSNYLSITTSVNGIVKKVYVQEGDTVVEGQTIMEVTLDSDGEESRTDAYSSYLRAKNSLDSAKSKLYSLESAKINSEESFEDEKESNSYQSHDERVSYTLAENNYLTAESSYNEQVSTITQLEWALQSAWSSYESKSPTITASASGIIANITAVEGMQISNSVSEKSVRTVASIKQEGTPIASLSVGELDINNINVGQIVNITLSSIGNQTFTGKIAGIDKIGSLSGNVASYPVIVRFDEESTLVLPNMAVDAEIIINEQTNVLYVPSSAITQSRMGKFVITQENGEDTKVEVETGISNTQYTEIISGINEGTQVKVTSLPTSGFDNASSEGSVRIPGMGSGMGGGMPH